MRSRASWLLASLLVLAACPREGSTPGPVGATTAGGESADAGPETGERRSLRPTPRCGDDPCVLHAGAATYHRCLAGAAGACFHYGARCEPADACMIDLATGTFRHCDEPVEGRCGRWGDTCEPAGRCLLDPSDGLYRTCDQVVGGRCQGYGELCDPA